MTNSYRKYLMVCALAMVGFQEAPAQSVEVFGGYTVDTVKSDADSDHTTMHGWNTSLTGYPTSRFGITADFAGYYGDARTAAGGSSGSPTAGIHQYSFMAGPQFRLFRKERFETSLRAVFGGAHGRLLGPDSSATALDDTTFAALFGSNFDVNLSKKVAIRFSPGIYLTQFNGETQKNFRFSVGPVFRFGGREN